MPHTFSREQKVVPNRCANPVRSFLLKLGKNVAIVFMELRQSSKSRDRLARNMRSSVPTMRF